MSCQVEPGPFDQFTYESPARRSPRKRAQVTYQDHDASAGESDLTDLEDLASPRRSPVKKTTTRTLVKFTRKNAKHIEVKEEDTAMEGGKAKVKAKGPRVAKPKKVPSKLEVLHPAPDGWEEVYGIIKAMRKREIAPVDTMGCQLAGKDEADPKVPDRPLTVQNRN
jgi:endonuclease-3